VKSYLAGNPPIALALNDSLAIGRREGDGGTYGGAGAHDAVMLDDCNFHESVALTRFDSERTLELVPPDGEIAVMNYRWCPKNPYPPGCRARNPFLKT
jgi:AP-4 complex subunit mu-1